MNNETYKIDLALTKLPATNMKNMLQALSKQISTMINAPERILFVRLEKNMCQQNISVINGVLIIDLKMGALTSPFTVFAKMDAPLQMEMMGSEDVGMICIVMSPEHDTAEHLQRLSRWTRAFHDTDLCAALEESNNVNDIHDAMMQINLEHQLAA